MNNNFTKEDLQTGHIVVTRNEGNAIVIGKFLKRSEYLMRDEMIMAEIKDYTSDLRENILEEFTIDKVYKIAGGKESLRTLIDELPKDSVELIWERKKEIDWSKVPKFTRVQVRDDNEDEWKDRYFIKYVENRPQPYFVTYYGEFTYDGYCTGWNQIRIYDESEIREDWYK